MCSKHDFIVETISRHEETLESLNEPVDDQNGRKTSDRNRVSRAVSPQRYDPTFDTSPLGYMRSSRPRKRRYINFGDLPYELKGYEKQIKNRIEEVEECLFGIDLWSKTTSVVIIGYMMQLECSLPEIDFKLDEFIEMARDGGIMLEHAVDRVYEGNVKNTENCYANYFSQPSIVVMKLVFGDNNNVNGLNLRQKKQRYQRHLSLTSISSVTHGYISSTFTKMKQTSSAINPLSCFSIVITHAPGWSTLFDQYIINLQAEDAETALTWVTGLRQLKHLDGQKKLRTTYAAERPVKLQFPRYEPKVPKRRYGMVFSKPGAAPPSNDIEEDAIADVCNSKEDAELREIDVIHDISPINSQQSEEHQNSDIPIKGFHNHHQPVGMMNQKSVSFLPTIEFIQPVLSSPTHPKRDVGSRQVKSVLKKRIDKLQPSKSVNFAEYDIDGLDKMQLEKNTRQNAYLHSWQKNKMRNSPGFNMSTSYMQMYGTECRIYGSNLYAHIDLENIYE